MLASHSRYNRLFFRAAVALAASTLALHSAMSRADQIKVSLSGSQEVPAVTTSASGNGTIAINSDSTVSGSITTTGITATAAHIHVGSAGKNGPVIIPLTKSGDNGWSVPAGAKLNDTQMKSYKAGDLYVNVHSAAHPGGEIRAQLK